MKTNRNFSFQYNNEDNFDINSKEIKDYYNYNNGKMNAIVEDNIDFADLEISPKFIN